MKNRPRPPISLGTKNDVAGDQLLRGGVRVFEDFSREEGETQTALLERRLVKLAEVLRCDRKDLRLDHDPALRIRTFDETRYHRIMKAFREKKLTNRERWRRVAACYTPNANDWTHLRYREDHHIKTNVHGDRGQFPDRVLIKRERKRERSKKRGKIGPKFRTQKSGRSRSQPPRGRSTIPARANPWPPRGSRPLRTNR